MSTLFRALAFLIGDVLSLEAQLGHHGARAPNVYFVHTWSVRV
jgi:hypothetical protein